MEKVDVSQFTAFFEKTKIKEVMKTAVETLDINDELSLAEEKFVTKRLYYLPVLDKEGRLAGILSQKYLYKTKSPRKLMDKDLRFDRSVVIDGESYYDKGTLDGYILSNMMNKAPLTLSPEDPIGKAVVIMTERNSTCIGIIDAKRIFVGLLTHLEVIGIISTVLKFRGTFTF